MGDEDKGLSTDGRAIMSELRNIGARLDEQEARFQLLLEKLEGPNGPQTPGETPDARRDAIGSFMAGSDAANEAARAALGPPPKIRDLKAREQEAEREWKEQRDKRRAEHTKRIEQAEPATVHKHTACQGRGCDGCHWTGLVIESDQ